MRGTIPSLGEYVLVVDEFFLRGMVEFKLGLLAEQPHAEVPGAGLEVKKGVDLTSTSSRRLANRY